MNEPGGKVLSVPERREEIVVERSGGPIAQGLRSWVPPTYTAWKSPGATSISVG